MKQAESPDFSRALALTFAMPVRHAMLGDGPQRPLVEQYKPFATSVITAISRSTREGSLSASWNGSSILLSSSGALHPA
jgi:hypothetical protein